MCLGFLSSLCFSVGLCLGFLFGFLSGLFFSSLGFLSSLRFSVGFCLGFLFGFLSGLCFSVGLCLGFFLGLLFGFFGVLFCLDSIFFSLRFLLSLESLFFGSLQCSLIGFGFGFDLSTGLLHPFVTVNSTGVMLNRFIDAVFRSTVELGQLCEGEDAQCVELLFTVWTDALDGLEVILVLLGGGTDTVEIDVLLSFLDAVDGLLLLRFSLDFIRFDGDAPKEIHTCLSKFETTLIGAAFIGWECTVIELEVDDDLSIFTNGELPSAFFCEGTFKHLESSVVLKFVVVLHFDLDVAHTGDGDFFNTRMNTSRLDVLKRGEDERIVFRACTGNERRFCGGVLGLWAICEHHQNLVAAKEERNK